MLKGPTHTEPLILILLKAVEARITFWVPLSMTQELMETILYVSIEPLSGLKFVKIAEFVWHTWIIHNRFLTPFSVNFCE